MDRFTKLRELGAGGYGAAFLVKRNTDAKEFVIKEVQEIKPCEKDYATEEATKMKELRHVNIVRYEDAWFNEDETTFYILMEYCDQGDMQKCIQDTNGCFFSERKIVAWALQICNALKHCHDRNVLHRDLKVHLFRIEISLIVQKGCKFHDVKR